MLICLELKVEISAFPMRSRDVSKTKKKIWDDIVNFKLPKQKYPVSWLVKKFMPVPGWTEEDIDELHK